MQVNQKNVGRIAERIAMNELEARGFQIIDLAYVSKTSANVDFIASKEGRSFNVQVKGATNTPEKRDWVQYGYCTEEVVRGNSTFFNRKSDAALSADIVVLVAVESPSHYRAIVLPEGAAEKAAGMNLDRYYRQPKLDGGKRKPGKVWIDLEKSKKPRKEDPLRDQEREFLLKFEDCWDLTRTRMWD